MPGDQSSIFFTVVAIHACARRVLRLGRLLQGGTIVSTQRDGNRRFDVPTPRAKRTRPVKPLDQIRA
jgi:hypothetical protein